MGGKFTGAGPGTARLRWVLSRLQGEQAAVLVELLLTLGLSLLSFAVLQQLMGMVYEAHSHNANRAELQYSARMALDCIQRDIRYARDFQVSADGRKLMITGAEGENIRILVQNRNLYRQDVSNTPVAENLSAVHFHKSAAALQGKLELENSKSKYCLDFFCFSRTLQAQE